MATACSPTGSLQQRPICLFLVLALAVSSIFILAFNPISDPLFDGRNQVCITAHFSTWPKLTPAATLDTPTINTTHIDTRGGAGGDGEEDTTFNTSSLRGLPPALNISLPTATLDTPTTNSTHNDTGGGSDGEEDTTFNTSSLRGLRPALNISLHELFFSRTVIKNVEDIDAFPSGDSKLEFRSVFLPNRNFKSYEVLAMGNVCMVPGGTLLLVGITEEDVQKNMSISGLLQIWRYMYSNCGNVIGDRCTGLLYTKNPPQNASWLPGNTLHYIPYLGNSFHNFAERIWPRLASHVLPLNQSTPQPVHHFIIHRFEKWLHEATGFLDRDQLLWQLRMLMEIWPGSDLILTDALSRTICFERFLLQMHDKDRLDHTRLPEEISTEALQEYRHAIFRFLGLPLPEIPLPPKRLRVLYYGRSDTVRRRVTNNEEVLNLLQNFTRPKFEVRSFDQLLQTKQASPRFLSMLSVFSQTDILVIAHGASTWATLFMPEGAGVIEVFGPCDWMKPRVRAADLTNMRSWIPRIAAALHLKHDISNPFREAVPNPRRGNTTKCIDPFTGVPDYSLDVNKISEIVSSFAAPRWPGDRLTVHWLYDWQRTRRGTLHV